MIYELRGEFDEFKKCKMIEEVPSRRYSQKVFKALEEFCSHEI